MSDVTQILAAPWYQSRTLWAALVTAIINIATSAGYKVDPFWANSLPDLLLNAASVVGAGTTIWLHLRSKKAISNAIATPSKGTSP